MKVGILNSYWISLMDGKVRFSMIQYIYIRLGYEKLYLPTYTNTR